MGTIVRLLFFYVFFHCAIGQQLCPGDQASISCDSSDRVIWSGTIFDNQCPPNNRINIQDITADSINNTYNCGNFTVTVIDFVIRTVSPGVELMVSTTLLTFSVVSNALDQRSFACLDGIQTVIGGNFSISVIPTPSVFVSQDSLTAVTVTLTVGDNRCASMYFVEIAQTDSSDPPIVINSSSSSIVVTDLDLCRNRYSVVGFVEASSGEQGGRNSSQEIPSGLEVVTNLEANPLMLTLNWTQPASNAPDSCISGYVISWSDGEDTTVGFSTLVMVSTLRNFPFCQTQNLTVTPNTRSGPLSMGTSLQDVIFKHPDFTAPDVSVFFTLQSSKLFINIMWKNISLEAVPLRMFGFSKIEESVCNPQNSAIGLSVTESVSGAQSGDSYTVCVVFTNFECTEQTDITVTVPAPVITNPQSIAGDHSISVTVILPASPPMSPNNLIILSTIDPPHADVSAVSAGYPISSQEYTVTFDGLTPGTTYTYNIKVVLRNDSTTTIGLQVTGSSTVPACGTVCVTVVVVVCAVLVVVAVLSLAGGVGAYKYKNRSKDPKERLSNSEDAEKHKLTRSSPPPGPDSLYADPNTIEHQAAPGTEDQYAMVDRKGKKNTKPKPTPPDALYQDPNTIEHETAASGDTYAVVDKPKKKGGPDVVPPASEGLTYADIDLSSKRPKPGSGRQAPQQPGEYPKEHPVEYSSVDHGNTSQL